MNFTYAFFLNIRNLCNSIFQALYLFGKMATITITFIVSSRIIAILLALVNMGATGVIIGYIIGSIIALTVAINFLRGKLPKTTKTTPIRPLIFYSLPLFLTSIATLILQWADIIIITSITGDLALTGIYSIVINSVTILSILYLPIKTTIFPALSSHYGLEKPTSISNILKTTSRYMFYILVPSCIGLAVIAPTALTLFYGPSYAKGATPLAILSIMTIITALLALYTTTFQAIGKTGQILKITIIAAITTILTLLSLVPLLETTGAATSRLITKIITFALAIYILKKEIKIRLDKEALWKSTLSTTAFIPFLLAIELTLSPKLSTIQTVALEILTAATIYILSLYALKALKKQDFQLLKQAFPKPLTKYINIIERIIVR
jgi:stage V sporulation protein B